MIEIWNAVVLVISFLVGFCGEAGTRPGLKFISWLVLFEKRVFEKAQFHAHTTLAFKFNFNTQKKSKNRKISVDNVRMHINLSLNFNPKLKNQKLKNRWVSISWAILRLCQQIYYISMQFNAFNAIRTHWCSENEILLLILIPFF